MLRIGTNRTAKKLKDYKLNQLYITYRKEYGFFLSIYVGKDKYCEEYNKFYMLAPVIGMIDNSSSTVSYYISEDYLKTYTIPFLKVALHTHIVKEAFLSDSFSYIFEIDTTGFCTSEEIQTWVNGNLISGAFVNVVREDNNELAKKNEKDSMRQEELKKLYVRSKDLEIGRVYKTLRKVNYIYLGRNSKKEYCYFNIDDDNIKYWVEKGSIVHMLSSLWYRIEETTTPKRLYPVDDTIRNKYKLNQSDRFAGFNDWNALKGYKK